MKYAKRSENCVNTDTLYISLLLNVTHYKSDAPMREISLHHECIKAYK